MSSYLVRRIEQTGNIERTTTIPTMLVMDFSVSWQKPRRRAGTIL
jgi:hypothetical protein